MKRFHYFALFLVPVLLISACQSVQEEISDAPVEVPVVNPVVAPVETQEEVSITIQTPQEGAELESPVHVVGMAPGNWFFEAQAPIFLYAQSDGSLIAQGTATVTSGDWMSTEQVTFEATIDFEITEPVYARLVLEKSNPSDLPENDDSFKWDIRLLLPN